MLDEIEKAPLAGGAFSELPLRDGAGHSKKNSPPRQNTQIKFQDPAEAEFAAEIAFVLTASGWRAAAALLSHAARCIESGDLLAAEHARQAARQQFNQSSSRFHALQEASRRDGILTEGAP